MRARRTKAQMDMLRNQILHVLKADHPQSVRHVLYRLTDPTLPEPVEKTEAGYTTVQRLLTSMRREELVPYYWITDMTRRGHFTETFDSPADAVEDIARFYRRSVWRDNPVYCEVWCESRSIAGVIQSVTRRHAVPLYPSGGFVSVTLAYEAAKEMEITARGRDAVVLYIGDYDPSGLLIDQHIEREMREHLPADFSLTFRRIAITPEQIDLMRLPTKPPKDRRGGFEGETVEAEAMPAQKMRNLLDDAINELIDPDVMRVVEAAEESERMILDGLAQTLRDAA